MTPSKNEIQVAIHVLRDHSGDWRGQEGPLKSCATLALGMQLTGLEMGVFAPLHGPYSTLIQHISDRCTEGAVQMVKVADTLNAVASVYAAEEADNVHHLKGLY